MVPFIHDFASENNKTMHFARWQHNDGMYSSNDKVMNELGSNRMQVGYENINAKATDVNNEQITGGNYNGAISKRNVNYLNRDLDVNFNIMECTRNDIEKCVKLFKENGRFLRVVNFNAL